MTSPSGPATICMTAEISLDGTGTYTGPHDDVTAAVAAEPGVTIVEGRESARALSPPRVPGYQYELHNDDGRYSPENPGSLVYQRLFPSRPNRIIAYVGSQRKWRSPATWRNGGLWRGRRAFVAASGAVDDITQTTDFGDMRVGLSNLGTMSVLINQVVTVGLQQNIRTDQAISLLLQAAGWPPGKALISIGDTTLSYWWCDGRSPWTAILELLAAEGPCQLYQDGDGVLHFENRNYRAVQPRSATSQATFGPTSATPLWYTSLTYEPGFKSLYNRAIYATTRRQLAALQRVWSYGTQLTLNPNEVRTLIVRPDNPFNNGATPVEGTHFTCTPSGAVTATVSPTAGFMTFMTLTADGRGATVLGPSSAATGIEFWAQPLIVISNVEVANTIDASASIAKYSPIPGANVPRTLTVQGWPEIDPAAATAVCNAWVSRYMEPRPQLSIVLRNGNADHLEQIFERQVSDRLTIDAPRIGGSGRQVWLETKQTTIRGAGGRVVECVFGCELCDVLQGSVWDASTALWGSSPSDSNGAIWGS